MITEAERLRKANNDLQQRLRYVAKEFKKLKEETRALSEEKRSFVSLNEKKRCIEGEDKNSKEKEKEQDKEEKS